MKPPRLMGKVSLCAIGQSKLFLVVLTFCLQSDHCFQNTMVPFESCFASGYDNLAHTFSPDLPVIQEAS